MARKITIRRVGGLLPALSLVVLVLLASLITWLSTAGLPESALRSLEQQAASQGIYLHVGKLKLAPASGLAVRARNVALYAAEGDEKPLATLERATLGISLGALLRGELQPTMAEFRNLDISLPTDGEAPLLIEDATASAVIRRGSRVRLTSATARLQGIPVTMRGSFNLPGAEEEEDTAPSQEEGTESSSTPIDISALLEPWRQELGTVQRAITTQNWQQDELPSINLQLETLRTPQLAARITIPCYDEGQFHFRDVSLDVAYQNKTLLINRAHFRTVEPKSEVTLQGGYDTLTRHLSINLKSTAALTRMAETLSLHGVNMDTLTSWLQRFRHQDDKPPSITLRGDVYFEEDFSPKSLSLTGVLSQHDFVFGQTEIEELSLSFFYRDGSFNIDRLQLAFPSGSLTLSASASAETHKGKARLTADLDIPKLLQFASEFTTEPLTLPEGLELSGNVQLELAAELNMPAFVSGSTRLEQFLPALHRVELALAIDEASHFGYSLKQPQLRIILDGLHQAEGSLVPGGLSQAQLSCRALAATLPRQEGEESATTLHQANVELNLCDLSLDWQAEGGPTPLIGSASGSLRLGALELPGFRAEAVELHLTEAEHLRPLAKDWRQMLREAELRLSTGALHAGDTLLGALDSRLQLQAGGHINLTTILEREGHRLHLDLHPQLTQEGLLMLEEVQLELPAAGFAPLLALTGTNVSQIRLPDTLFLSGSASYDTRAGYLRQAEAQLSIPHLVRTPGEGVAAFKGREVPLSVNLRGQATGRPDGNLSLRGELAVIHKAEKAADERQLQLLFSGESASHLHLSGTNTIDVGIIDQLLDLRSAHAIMRDFDTHRGSRTDVDIRSVDINWANGLSVTASCDARIRDIGYQMNAYVDGKDSRGRPTGRETLRTDFGKAPFRRIEKATAHVDVLYRENAKGVVEATTISILNADLTYDNRPWLRSQNIKNGVARTRLTGGAVIIDVHDGFVELRDVQGKAYPSYAIGAYYDDLPGFLKDLILDKPVTLETKNCVFPFYKDCPRSMSGSIRILADTANYRFLGTTFPFTSFSGFIWFRDGAVCLDRLNAACWDGAVNAAIVIDYSGKHTGFDGYVTLRNINLKPLATSYGSKQETALCNGSIRFRTPSPELDDLQAYGDVHIVNGDLMSLRIFRPVGDLIADLPGNLAALERAALSSEGAEPTWLDRQLTKLFKTTGDTFSDVGEQLGRVTNNIPFANHFLRYDLQEVHSRFTIGRGRLVTDGMKALGYNLNVGLQLELDLEDLTLTGDIWPKISSVPTIILSPITFLSDFMIDIHVFGPIDDIQWKFGLNRKREEEENECSVTDEEPKQNMKPRKR